MNYLELGYDKLFRRRRGADSPTRLSPTAVRSTFPLGALPAASITPTVFFTTSIKFSATDYNTATWTEGVINFPDGRTTETIATGNTGNITATTYVYYDKGIKASLQTTTTAADAIGDNKTLLAVVELASDQEALATITTLNLPKVTDKINKVINCDNASLTYSGTWTLTSHVLFYGGNYKTSATSTDYVEYTFNAPTGGAKVGLLVGMDSSSGKIDVYIDDELNSEAIDLYSANLLSRHLKYQSSTLAEGEHTIKVVVRSDKNASSSAYNFFLDGFVVGNLVAINNLLMTNYIVQSSVALSTVGYATIGLAGLPTGYTALGITGASITTPGVNNTVWATGTTGTTANAETAGSDVVVEVGAGELRGFAAGDTVYITDGVNAEWTEVDGLTLATPSMTLDLDNNYNAGAAIIKYNRSRMKLMWIASTLYIYDGISKASVTVNLNVLTSKDNS